MPAGASPPAPRRPDSKYPRQFRNRALHEKREADILRLAARPSPPAPLRPDSRRQRQVRYAHCAGSVERRYSAMPAPARRNKKPSLRKRRDGMIRGATLIEGAKRLPLKTVNAGQTYRTTASTRVPPVCRRVSVPPVPLAAPFQPRGASLSRHRWEFPVDHALLFL